MQFNDYRLFQKTTRTKAQICKQANNIKKTKTKSTNNEEEEDPRKIDNININQNSPTKQNQTKNTKGNTKGTKRKQLDWSSEENFPLLVKTI